MKLAAIAYRLSVMSTLTAIVLSGDVAHGAEQAATDTPQPPAALVDWIKAHQGGDWSIDELRELYASTGSETDRLARVVVLVGDVDPRVAKLTTGLLSMGWDQLAAPPDWFAEESLPGSAQASVALLIAGELHARRYYEETLAWLEGVDASGTVAPHLASYYRAVANHQLVRLDQAVADAKELLESGDRAGRRHRELAELILRDARSADAKSPEGLARQMNDIRRRLRLGRSADPEQDLQKQVIDALDKMIEQAEQQQQQQQQQQAGAAQPSAPSTPAQGSRPGDYKGPGEVDPRDVAAGGDWGSLPPQERERVTQQIGRDFPAYYRDVIEAYFRSLAAGEGGAGERAMGESEENK